MLRRASSRASGVTLVAATLPRRAGASEALTCARALAAGSALPRRPSRSTYHRCFDARCRIQRQPRAGADATPLSSRRRRCKHSANTRTNRNTATTARARTGIRKDRRDNCQHGRCVGARVQPSAARELQRMGQRGGACPSARGSDTGRLARASRRGRGRTVESTAVIVQAPGPTFDRCVGTATHGRPSHSPPRKRCGHQAQRNPLQAKSK